MAGVTDKPYRRVCREHGAGMVVSEMVTSQSELRQSRKTRFRLDHTGEPEPIVVQIVGTDPTTLASAAQYNVANGAQIIDINMGCPAKKVCKKAAGSALLANETLVADILSTVVNAVEVPVTVKIRTGPTPDTRNATRIARIAEDSGVSALTIHGRTRECKFVGAVEYDSIAKVASLVDIPVIANGDINTPKQARRIIDYTGADAVMIGRAAQGRPWLFKQVSDYLTTGQHASQPDLLVRINTIMNHLADIHSFYGGLLGVRLARKHIKWYLTHWDQKIDELQRQAINQSEDACEQLTLVGDFLYSSMIDAAA